MDYIYSQRQIENAVLLAADLYKRLYESETVGGDSSCVTQTIIQEACNMETWLDQKYGHDDDEYLDHLEEYERMIEEKYGLPSSTES